MPVFEYRGRDNQGQSVSGTLEATSQEAALRDLKNKQILPSLLQQGKRRSDSDIIKSLQRAFKDSRKPKVQPDDLIMFCRQMYALMKAGIPLLRAIGGLADNAKSARLGEVLHQIQRQLQGGTDLATAFAHHKVFDDLFVAMIRMGETTGRLDQAFQQLIFHLEQEKETRKRMISAVRYPSFVLISIAIAMVIINWMVIPESDFS